MGDLALAIASHSLPTMSPELRGWFLDDLDMEWVAPAAGRAAILLPHYRDRSSLVLGEATALLSSYAQVASPPSAAFLADWLKPLAAVVRNPVSAAELDQIAPIFAAALADIPIGAFSLPTWRLAMQTFKFWPSPADIAELVAPAAQEIRRTVAVLKFIAEGGS